MEKCKNYEKNMKDCPCTYEPCSRKGFCCECLRYHMKNGGLIRTFKEAKQRRSGYENLGFS
ncbi:MAG: hypothetical protein HQ566_01100 [Candidatus Omnitrophica bacterium]|nr:hypothetical protein [Candidatus Omnitrophota bacterium]